MELKSIKDVKKAEGFGIADVIDVVSVVFGDSRVALHIHCNM